MLTNDDRNEITKALHEVLDDALGALAESAAELRIRIAKYCETQVAENKRAVQSQEEEAKRAIVAQVEASVAEARLSVAQFDPTHELRASLISVGDYCRRHWFGISASALVVWVLVRYVKHTFPNASDVARQDARRFGYVDDLARAGRSVEDIRNTYSRMRGPRNLPEPDPSRADPFAYDNRNKGYGAPVPRQQVFHEENM